MKTTDLPDDPSKLDRKEIASISSLNARSRLKEVNVDAHKGNRGHAAIIAGSSGMMGANILALRGTLKSGCGKVTTFIKDEYFTLVHGATPEVLVKSTNHFKLNINNFDATGFGSGLGISDETNSLLIEALSTSGPLLLDADALNMIAQNKKLWPKIPPDTILTPHVGEWERLFEKESTWRTRIEDSIETCIKLNINILIKGYYSVLVTSSGKFHINGTGNHGMAKGGSGDVLAGLITGLLAQGYDPESAGVIGMYIHGLAGDLAAQKIGHDAMLPSDSINFLSEAFKSLRKSAINT